MDRQNVRRRRQTGSAVVEFGILLLPMMGFLFLTLDIAWAIFAQSTLQQAVREGVRVGITGPSGGVDAAIRSVVARRSFGFIDSGYAGPRSANNDSVIKIDYFSPTNLSVPITGQAGCTAGGNVVRVSVIGLTMHSFGAIMRTDTPLNLSATASDVMETTSSTAPAE